MSVSKGDYIGFTIGDYHSSDLGIVRVSSSDRYNQNLLPTISDKTLQIPGGDGTFLFGSFYTQNPIHIDFAFDSLTDRQIRTIQQVLGSKKPQKLIFDEAPYKYYWVKSVGTPQIKYLSFDEPTGEYEYNEVEPDTYLVGSVVLKYNYYIHIIRDEYREVPAGTIYDPEETYYIYNESEESYTPVTPETEEIGIKYLNKDYYIYNSGAYILVYKDTEYDENETYYLKGQEISLKVNKGEGTIDLIAYKPYAHSRYKYLNEYTKDSIPEWDDPSDPDSFLYVNKNEWAAASGLLESQGDYDTFKTDGSSTISTYLYNAGIMPTDYKLVMKFYNGYIGTDNLNIYINNNSECQLRLQRIQKKDSDTHIILNTATNLLEGYIITNSGDNEIRQKTGNIYNDFILSGNFFQIPATNESIELIISNALGGGQPLSDYGIEYDYLYY